jgi:hypothetical protein
MSDSFVNESVANNPPQIVHIVITYIRGETSATDAYEVKTQGNFGGVALIGTLAIVQTWLLDGGMQFEDGEWVDSEFQPDKWKPDQLRITIENRAYENHAEWASDPCIPTDGLVGTLEMLKQSLVNAKMAEMAQRAARQSATGLLDRFGRPLRGNGNGPRGS